MLHPGLTTERWHTLSLHEQLGNIGSEVGRALKAKEQQKVKDSEAALFRALELFDLTLADERHRGARRREIARAREVTVDSLAEEPHYGGPDGLENYFMYFAMLARQDR